MQLGFDVEKRTSLERADLSRKGAIDDVIVPLVEHINSQEMWYTTSSCSGRITVYCQVREPGPVKSIVRYSKTAAGPTQLEERLPLDSRVTRVIKGSRNSNCVSNQCAPMSPFYLFIF